jgi:sugar/nucleoside kinase (ribokinase family)
MPSLFKKIFNSEYDIVTIGDIAVDAFIRLDGKTDRAEKSGQNQVRESVNPITGHRELCLAFGEKIPYQESLEVFAVGNSGNVAVACSRLGMKTGIISNVGDDLYGQKSIEKLRVEGVDPQFVKVNQGRKTNYHYILWYKDDRTILTKHEEYRYTLPSVINTKWLYLSSLSEHSVWMHGEIEKYLEKHTNVKLIFQPGTFQLKMGASALRKIYARSELFFCNLEEAEKIVGLEIVKASSSVSERAQNIKRLLLEICALGVKLPVITDGPAGSYVLVDGELYRMPIYNDIKKPVERNGAGDAFSATFSACYARGMTVEDSLKWASINSMNVCQHIGSHEGLLKEEQIRGFLAKAPKGWGLVRM